ncbi:MULTISPECIES: P-type DNA transfer ATPase VirB11 [Brucella]|uniref:Type IV secretion system protein n=1 Tax=Brucella tritici TaxID=94626 RepID=A0A6L3YFZ4_9HYPH|nr:MULTISPECIES: P-type DNA transfer ATPase VirB11 [Brucella]KAB2681161.1 P-type DNA transfer ATPase VirB11 [Brucella tritici]KAB2757357.1 P-type DNA transfer ATPase VirB11 [Brucella anthropi]KAB2775286.1 P-type DNA transfer ATPase VirB11 [Brucella anthropi]
MTVQPAADVWQKAPVLKATLEPIRKWLNEDAVSEISINQPGEIFIERLGVEKMEHVICREITQTWIREVCTGVASSTSQMVNAQKPILSAALPSGERFQCVLPPAAPNGGAISIRKQSIMNVTLDDYAALGAFDDTIMGTSMGLSQEEKQLVELLNDTSPLEFLEHAVRSRVSLVVSGGTSTGKTTFLNSLLKIIPDNERIITIEDTKELVSPVPNTLSLVASKGDQGMALVTPQMLLEATLRMRPDRILLGELRGEEAFSFLQAINTGHPGSLTTVHANSPRAAYERLALMVMQGKVGLTRDEIIEYLREVIPVVIQMRRTEKGRRVISEIKFTKSEAI